MKLVVVMFLVLSAMAYFGVPLEALESNNTGIQCQCAGFNDKKVKDDEKPLLVQNPLNTTCDEQGEHICLTMCLELAKMSEGKGPEMLCAHLENINELTPSMFIRVCNRKWVYSGITLDVPICCQNAAVVPCH